ncbi:MAG TPA: isoaspartyl peptidase/L-asparaginase [Terriglobales bacterium]|nr:isoaspartyl peptidase/L-asparaginase [Terriglobales bacterium]
MPIDPVLVVHGGAWAIPDDVVEDHRRGVQKALAAGWAVLASGGSALKAVEEAVVVMEDDQTFDAGCGSFLTSDGRVQMDAIIMDGATLRAGGVGCVERIRNPVRAARLILSESPHVYFVAEGAEQFAASLGMKLIDNRELVIDRERRRLAAAQAKAAAGERDLTFAGSPPHGHDTVGAIALDRDGHLAAATSTGGTLNKAPGRVGDASLIGCGCYADDQSAAVSCTGWGEPIMKLVLGKWAADRVEAGATPDAAAREAIGYLGSRLNGHGGMILLDAQGRFGIAHNTPRMAWGVKTKAKEEAGTEIGLQR